MTDREVSAFKAHVAKLVRLEAQKTPPDLGWIEVLCASARSVDEYWAHRRSVHADG